MSVGVELGGFVVDVDGVGVVVFLGGVPYPASGAGAGGGAGRVVVGPPAGDHRCSGAVADLDGAPDRVAGGEDRAGWIQAGRAGDLRALDEDVWIAVRLPGAYEGDDEIDDDAAISRWSAVVTHPDELGWPREALRHRADDPDDELEPLWPRHPNPAAATPAANLARKPALWRSRCTATGEADAKH
jgi:hypothetical protein